MTPSEDTSGALADFNCAADLDPSMPEIFFNRANLLQSLGISYRCVWSQQNPGLTESIGRHEEAEQDYTIVLHLSPLDSLAYSKRGDA